jgi:hypothetical protein
MTPDQPPDNKIPDLLRFERYLLVAVIIGAFGVGALGLLASFDTVGQQAQEWGFRPFWILPVAVDIAIPVFSLAHLLLIRADMPLGWVRAVPWTLTAVTMYLNVSAAGNSLAPQIGHGALPLLWVVCSEIAAHVYRALIGAVTGRRMERVRKSRWLLAPFSTARLWRRMVLWEVTSYRTGLRLESARLMARAELRDKHGRGWRRKTTQIQRVRLRMGELAPAEGVPELTAAPSPVLERVPAELPNEPELPTEPAEPPAEPELAPAELPEMPSELPGELSGELSDELELPAELPEEPGKLESEQAAAQGPGKLKPEPPVEQTAPTPVSLTDRATTKTAQVTAVLELMDLLGFDLVNIPVVQNELELTRSTAYARLKEARAAWHRRANPATETQTMSGT